MQKNKEMNIDDFVGCFEPLIVWLQSLTCTKIWFIDPLPSNAAFLVTHLRYIAVENIVRKGEIACNRQFLLFPQCFLS